MPAATVGARCIVATDTPIKVVTDRLGNSHAATCEHPRDDLHVLVRVGPEACPGATVSSLETEQQPVVRVGRVVVGTEAEAVAAVEPHEPRAEPGVGAAHVDRRRLRGAGGRHVPLASVRCSDRFGSFQLSRTKWHVYPFG